MCGHTSWLEKKKRQEMARKKEYIDEKKQQEGKIKSEEESVLGELIGMLPNSKFLGLKN